MLIPSNIIVNADDFGMNKSVNGAILFCFENGYINSTSMITNSIYFEESAYLVHKNEVIDNIGVHINLAEGRPVTNFDKYAFLDENGNWDINKVNRKLQVFNKQLQDAFLKEIFAQVDRARKQKIAIKHLDSHYHLHTLPCFFPLFIKAAKHYKLKLRLAQTINEGNPVKFLYRKIINQVIINSGSNYSDYFENIDYFLNRGRAIPQGQKVELMLHPDFTQGGKLTDHFDNKSVSRWISSLNAGRVEAGQT